MAEDLNNQKANEGDNRQRDRNNIQRALGRLVPIMKLLSNISTDCVTRIQRFDKEIVDDKLLLQSNKGRLRARIIGIKELLLTKPDDFMAKRDELVKALDEAGLKEIAGLAARINITNGEAVKILIEIMNLIAYFNRQAAASNPDNRNELSIRFSAKLKEYSERLQAVIVKSPEEEQVKKAAIEILSKVENITKENELNYLTAYLMDLDTLRRLAERGNINLENYIQRINEYLNGQGSSTTIKTASKPAVPIKGVISKFNDKRLKKEVDKNNLIRNLVTYKQQLIFIEEMWKLVLSVINNDKWEGSVTVLEDGNPIKITMPFLGPKGFYHNLDKGHNFIRRIRKDFGNHHFADELEKMKNDKRIGEQPVLWERELKKLYDVLHDPNYQARVIVGAINQLDTEFRIRIKELAEVQRKDLTSEERNIFAQIRKLQDSYKSSAERFTRAADKYSAYIYAEWLALKERYQSNERYLARKLDDFQSESMEIVQGFSLREFSSIFDEAEEQSFVLSQAINNHGKTIDISRLEPQALPGLYNNFFPLIVAEQQRNIAHLAKREIVMEADRRAKEALPKIEAQTRKGRELMRVHEELSKSLSELIKTMELDENKILQNAEKIEAAHLNQELNSGNNADNNHNKNKPDNQRLAG